MRERARGARRARKECAAARECADEKTIFMFTAPGAMSEEAHMRMKRGDAPLKKSARPSRVQMREMRERRA